MPKTTIPLSISPSQRGFSSISMSKDGLVSGLVPTAVPNTLNGTKAVFLQKRTGMTATDIGTGVCNAIFRSPSTGDAITSLGGGVLTEATIYKGSTSQGTLLEGANKYLAMHITETVIGGVTYWLISAITSSGSPTSGWYLPDDADTRTSYTGDTHTNTVIDNITQTTAGMYVGQRISGTNIAGGTRIASITSSSAITTTLATTGTTAGVTITKTPVALIIDADFPSTIVGPFVALNGRIFIMTPSGRVYQSGLNDPSTWSATEYVPSDLVSDNGSGLAISNNSIIAFGSLGAEILDNVGNPSGSVLISRQNEAFYGGAKQNIAGNTNNFNSLISFDGYRVAWISDYGSSGGAVRLIDSSGRRTVSTEVVNSILMSATALSCDLFGAWGQSWISVAFTDGSTSGNLLYSIENDFWCLANFPSPLLISGTSAARDAFLSAFSGVSAASMTDTTGLLYTFSQSAYQDNSANYAWAATTDNLSLNNGEPFIITHIDLIGDTYSSGSVTLTVTEDDYQNFVTLGTFDLTQAVKRIDGCGQFPSTVAFKLTETANRAWRGQALVVHWQPCGRPN